MFISHGSTPQNLKILLWLPQNSPPLCLHAYTAHFLKHNFNPILYGLLCYSLNILEYEYYYYYYL